MATDLPNFFFKGVTYPAIHAMWNHWAPPLERASLVTGAFAGAYLGASLSMAQFVSSDSAISWEQIFYLSGEFAQFYQSSTLNFPVSPQITDLLFIL